jgi:hypothetical protein
MHMFTITSDQLAIVHGGEDKTPPAQPKTFRVIGEHELPGKNGYRSLAHPIYQCTENADGTLTCKPTEWKGSFMRSSPFDRPFK